MEGQLEYLFAGFAVFWAGLLVYLVWLQARLRALQAEVRRLEERLAEEVPVAEATAATRSASAARVAPEGGA
ncbi:MAG: CcmD family protein [Dehalococcoidia bacterium]|nr:CcmD family protein [Dehalococcoidia bacterium]